VGVYATVLAAVRVPTTLGKASVAVGTFATEVKEWEVEVAVLKYGFSSVPQL